MAARRNRRAGVEDLWSKTVRDKDGKTRRVPSKLHGSGKRWRARYVDDAGHEHTKRFVRKVDAQDWLDAATAAQMTGTYVDPRRGRITFGEYYLQWFDMQLWHASGTRDNTKLAADSVTFSDVALSELRPSHLQKWVNWMASRENPLAASTIRTRYNSVRPILKSARTDRYMASDPTEGVKLPRVRRADAAMVIPTPDEVRRLYNGADAHFPTLVAVCAFAGLRHGEAAGLKVGDIEFLGRELHVRRQVQRGQGTAVELRPPKYGSERTVSISAELTKILSRHIAEYCEGDGPDRWLFPNGRTGNPVHQNWVDYRMRKAKRKSKQANAEWTLHDLRHFYASGLIADGCDVVTVQKMLGHLSATETLSTYAHLWPGSEDRARTAAASLYRQVFGSAAYPLRTLADK